MRGTLAAAAILALLISDAVATQSYGSTEKLVGWSAGGAIWATVDEDLNSGAKSLTIHTAGGQSETTCDEAESDCDPERVDLLGHPELAEHGFVRLDRSWRAGFKALYTLRATKLGGRDDKTCDKSFELVPRFPWASTTLTAKHCLAQLAGGYLHPSGDFLLIKVREVWEETDDVGTSDYDSTRYIWLEH